MGPYQRTPNEVARAIRFSGLGVRSVGPVGDLLETCLFEIEGGDFQWYFRLVYYEYWVEKETRSHGFFVNLQLGGGYCPLTISIIPFLPI